MPNKEREVIAMNIVLTTLNAKYTHHNLALRYLRAYCKDAFPGIVVKEFNINQQLSMILSELVDQSPDVLGFSCYIWNIEQTLELITNLKKVMPHVIIVLGGPEVSYDYHDLMQRFQTIDYIIVGEGEKPLLELLTLLNVDRQPTASQLQNVPSLVYRINGAIHVNPSLTMDLAEIPGAYQDHLEELEHKIVYYETSRGCPFGCEYCLSARSGKVRYFPMERVKAELKQLAGLGIEQIRFVDRTFNCDRQRAYELIRFMMELETTTRFQLEIGGDLLTDELIQLLEQAPANRFQFEIGVQSTNLETLRQVGRTSDLSKLADNCRKLRERTKVRFLLDLIAGLPDESFERFGYSFDYVYQLQPTKIQLGFLKLLKGSRLRERVEEFGCVFTDKAPYEVLSTSSISYQQLAFLKVIEDLVEAYYNSGRFTTSLNYLIERNKTRPFLMFSTLAEKWKKHGYHLISHNLFDLYQLLWEQMGDDDPLLLNYLRYDFRLHEPKRATPAWMGGMPTQDLARRLIHEGTIYKYIPQLERLRMSPREISKCFMLEIFDYPVHPLKPQLQLEPGQQLLLFDYTTYPQVHVYTVDASDTCLE